MLKVTDKFAETVQNVMHEFSRVLANTVDSKLADIIQRIEVLEARLPQPLDEEGATVNKNTTITPNIEAAAEIASRTLMELEREKEDIKARSQNVIISGLASNQADDDRAVVEDFCEQHLTVKPRIIRVRRLGKNRQNSNPKLCVTLDNSDSVGDLLSSATLLRSSTDVSVKQVFFNRDLTKKQAETAYKQRCLKRSKQAGEHLNNDAMTDDDQQANLFDGNTGDEGLMHRTSSLTTARSNKQTKPGRATTVSANSSNQRASNSSTSTTRTSARIHAASSDEIQPQLNPAAASFPTQ